MGEVDNPLVSLIGEKLSTVAFVMDYVEFHFDGAVLRAIADPLLYQGGSVWRFPEPCSRDALCSLIGSVVERVDIQSDIRIELTFLTGERLQIPLDAEHQHAGESAHFIPHRKGPMQVW